MPPELKANKSVIVPRVDNLLYEKNKMDIGEKLLKQNLWIVYKFTKPLTNQTNIFSDYDSKRMYRN